MKDVVPKKYNIENFFYAYKILKKFNVFPFFGTLLGIVRDGDIIEGDDDVDFYANVIFREEINDALSKAGFEIKNDFTDQACKYFTQAFRQIEGISTYVDIYFYEKNEELDYIIDRWNFMGHYNIPECWLNIKKNILFPLRTHNFLGVDILIPNKPRKCCKFLYGQDWTVKKSKVAGEYKVLIHNSQPLIVHNGDYIYHLTEAHSIMNEEIIKLRAELSGIDKLGLPL